MTDEDALQNYNDVCDDYRDRALTAEALLADIYVSVSTGRAVYADGYWCWQDAFEPILDRLSAACAALDEPVPGEGQANG